MVINGHQLNGCRDVCLTPAVVDVRRARFAPELPDCATGVGARVLSEGVNMPRLIARALRPLTGQSTDPSVSNRHGLKNGNNLYSACVGECRGLLSLLGKWPLFRRRPGKQ